jgi:hypothetical protein
MDDLVRELDDIVGYGVVHDIFEAEETLAILMFTGQNAKAINEATFGAFFGELQRILGQTLQLSVARMFEREKTYPLRSIPAALNFLKERCGYIPIRDRPALLSALRKLGHHDEASSHSSYQDLTFAVADAFLHELERLQSVAGTAIKTIRDKVIAHRERIAEDALPRATYAQIDELIAYAKDVTTAVGHGYTGVGYRADGGQYYLTSDAERAVRSLKRLLTAAGVVFKPSDDLL